MDAASEAPSEMRRHRHHHPAVLGLAKARPKLDTKAHANLTRHGMHGPALRAPHEPIQRRLVAPETHESVEGAGIATGHASHDGSAIRGLRPGADECLRTARGGRQACPTAVAPDAPATEGDRLFERIVHVGRPPPEQRPLRRGAEEGSRANGERRSVASEARS